jgi:hypothetical protein
MVRQAKERQGPGGVLHGGYADSRPEKKLKEGWADSRQPQRGHLSLGSSNYPGVRSKAGEKSKEIEMEENGGSRGRGEGREGKGRNKERERNSRERERQV